MQPYVDPDVFHQSWTCHSCNQSNQKDADIFPVAFQCLQIFRQNWKKGCKKYMYITCTFFMYSVTWSYALFILFKKNQFCSRSSKESIGAMPVICSLASHSAIQLCGVSFLFWAVEALRMEILQVFRLTVNQTQDLAPPVCCVVVNYSIYKIGWLKVVWVKL